MSNLHSEQLDPHIHNPKGFAAASAGTIGWKNESNNWVFEERNNLPKAINIVDNTAVPPTEVNGDIYIIDATGASHANWDGAVANSWVRYNSVTDLWSSIAPFSGAFVYVSASLKHFFYNGTVWSSVDTGSLTFTGLSDTPATYSGQSLKVVRVNSGETGLEFATISGGVTTFTGLTDTPSSYTSQSLKGVRVNAGETALEFYTITDADTNIFNTNGSLTGNRTVTMGANTLSFVGNQTLFSGLDNGAVNFALKVNSLSNNLLHVRNDGNIGIGTTAPTYKLTVNSTEVNDYIMLKRSNLNQASLAFTTTYGGSLNLNNSSGGTQLVSLNSTTDDWINTGKNLGIGTTGPTYKLTVNSTEVNDYIMLRRSNLNQASLAFTTTYGGSLNLNNSSGVTQLVSLNSTTVDWINTGKNLAIGATTAAYKLDVTGDVNVSGIYRVGTVAGVTQTGAYTNFTIVGGIITAAS